jgi:hypothetical protein
MAALLWTGERYELSGHRRLEKAVVGDISDLAQLQRRPASSPHPVFVSATDTDQSRIPLSFNLLPIRGTFLRLSNWTKLMLGYA